MKIIIEIEAEEIKKIIDYLDDKDVFSQTAHQFFHIVEKLRILTEKIDKIKMD